MTKQKRSFRIGLQIGTEDDASGHRAGERCTDEVCVGEIRVLKFRASEVRADERRTAAHHAVLRDIRQLRDLQGRLMGVRQDRPDSL
jgi:hypothetical protein